MLEDYLFYLKSKNRKSSTVRTYFAAIELLCVVHDKAGDLLGIENVEGFLDSDMDRPDPNRR